MQALGWFLIPETIAVRGDRKSRPKIHIKTTRNFFLPPPKRKDNSSCPSIGFAYGTMLQQLQNLTGDVITHGYQTCPPIESFFQEQVIELM